MCDLYVRVCTRDGRLTSLVRSTWLRGGMRSTGDFLNYCFKYYVRFDGVFVINFVSMLVSL
jgi:hypothetical protein